MFHTYGNKALQRNKRCLMRRNFVTNVTANLHAFVENFEVHDISINFLLYQLYSQQRGNEDDNRVNRSESFRGMGVESHRACDGRSLDRGNTYTIVLALDN